MQGEPPLLSRLLAQFRRRREAQGAGLAEAEKLRAHAIQEMSSNPRCFPLCPPSSFFLPDVQAHLFWIVGCPSCFDLLSL